MARAANGSTSGRPSLRLTEFAKGDVKNAIKTAGATRATHYMVPVEQIKVRPGFNLRLTNTPDHREAVEQLRQSIVTEGFYSTKPIACFTSLDADMNDVIYVIDGHLRLEAAKLAEVDAIPVIIKPADSTDLELAVSLQKENSGRPLSLLERAGLVRRLLSAGMTDIEIAERLGCTPRYVEDLKVLVGAPKEVREMVASGAIAGTEAIAQMRKDPDAAPEKLQKLAAKVEAKGKAKLTKSAIANDGVKPPRMATTTLGITLSRGYTEPWDKVEPFAALMPDTDWYTHTGRPNEIEVTEDLQIEVKIKRQTSGVRAAQAAPAAAVEPDNDDGYAGDEFDDDAPDLQRAGVADPANQGL